MLRLPSGFGFCSQKRESWLRSAGVCCHSTPPTHNSTDCCCCCNRRIITLMNTTDLLMMNQKQTRKKERKRERKTRVTDNYKKMIAVCLGCRAFILRTFFNLSHLLRWWWFSSAETQTPCMVGWLQLHFRDKLHSCPFLFTKNKREDDGCFFFFFFFFSEKKEHMIISFTSGMEGSLKDATKY